jgi:hypothetical protein
MSTKPLAEVFEQLKELRRGGAPNREIQSEIMSELVGSFDDWTNGAFVEDIEIVEGEDKSHQFPNSVRAAIFRVLEIKTLADRVFGDVERAEAWLRRPNASLSDQRPLDLLEDELGAAVVREMLERIDHGIFA